MLSDSPQFDTTVIPRAQFDIAARVGKWKAKTASIFGLFKSFAAHERRQLASTVNAA